MKMRYTLRSILALGVLPLMLAGCVVDDDTVADNPPPPLVQQAPPLTAPVEQIPNLTDPQTQLWRPGYWAMLNNQFVWVPGKVIARPSKTAVWHNAYWMQHEFGWSFQMGHWE
ncbi:MAG: hypothetical protein P4M15_00940 [Alphaproteobacteria bacterium]|nr:hypothetical protein [Alphaproteobacteria bacterium]